MDLLSSRPLREGSRGGQSEFSWESVKNDKDRENYLGHSIMAPVGRWQHGKDLTWYAKNNKNSNPATIEDERAAEIRKIKEAEEDALARALGLPVKVRNREPETQISQDEIKRVVGAVAGEDDIVEGKGVGLGKLGDAMGLRGGDREKPEDGQEYTRPNMETQNTKPGPRLPDRDTTRNLISQSQREDYRNERRQREASRDRNRNSRSRRDRSRSRDRKGRAGYEDHKRVSRRHRERSKSPAQRRKSVSRSRSRDRWREGRRRDDERHRREKDDKRRRDRSRERKYGGRR